MNRFEVDQKDVNANINIIGMKEDITKQFLFKEVLVENEHKFRTLFEKANEGIAIVDCKTGIIADLNEAFIQLTKIAEAEVVNISDLGPYFFGLIGDHRNGIEQDLSENAFNVEILVKDGTTKFVDVSVSKVRLSGGEFCLLVFHDETRRIEAERQLAFYKNHLEMLVEKRTIELFKAKEKEEESKRLKSAFLNSISHEIRTPMNAILGFLELAKASGLSETKRQEYFSVIQSSAFHLIDIIDDIIIASQIKTGGISIIKENIDVNALLEEIFSHYNPLATSKGLHLILKKTPDNLIISTDRYKLQRILSHLLDNAVKFSKEGTVIFGYDKNISETPDICFFVSDSGIGISELKKEIIFGYFNQVETEYSRRPEGTGLGLYIAKSFVEALGGKIWFESREGHGSEFMFIFL